MRRGRAEGGKEAQSQKAKIEMDGGEEMTMNEIEQMLRETGITVKHHHFETGEAPAPPYIIYLFPTTEQIRGDGKTFIKIKNLDIELYTDDKSEEMEERVEDILDKYGISYTKAESYIDTERMYEVLYETQV